MRMIKLMADYECYPLWEASPGNFGNIDPESLPISKILCEQLLDWASVYDRTLNWGDPATSGFLDADAVNIFKIEGMRLADQMREELGSDFSILVEIYAEMKVERV